MNDVKYKIKQAYEHNYGLTNLLLPDFLNENLTVLYASVT